MSDEITDTDRINLLSENECAIGYPSPKNPKSQWHIFFDNDAFDSSGFTLRAAIDGAIRKKRSK